MSWGQQPHQQPTTQWGGQPAGGPPPGKGPGWARKRIVIPAGAFLFLIGTGIGAAGDGGTETASDSKAAPTVTATVTAPAVAGAKAAPAPTVTRTVTAKPAGDAGEKPARKPVPNFIGMGLQAAQDSAQATGFYLLTSHDSTGDGRNQVFDRNWKVCSQDPRAGSVASVDTELNFGTVKREETCP
ncbi:PASTA domain-containing protein [Streptomyces sp. NPDC004609]|uniref:PASTA domain-containing protein n=1 Tax=Streptomyces sp. NPDC004609 TaxID=3364704 RepID=UPI00369B1649